MPRRKIVHRTARSFRLAMEREAKVVAPEVLLAVVKKVVLEIYRAIILRSPVDRGFYRASHNISVNFRDLSVPLSPAPGREISGVFGALQDLRMGDTVFITTNLPYSEVIEHGLYPDPPVGGEGKTIRGFSRQAPKGVYLVSIKSVLAKLRARGALA